MYDIYTLTEDTTPLLLREIPDKPKQIRMAGVFPQTAKYITIVGSRKCSDYGKEAVREIISGLAGYSVTIISGLAYGIDATVHRHALEYGLPTVAVPGSGLHPKVLYPRVHVSLAQEIIEAGGGLLSEYEDMTVAAPWTFPARNRIMAGLSHMVLVVEAELMSGTLITSKYATDYNRDVATISHHIFSKTGEGPHMLLKLGALPVRDASDIITAFGLTTQTSTDYTQPDSEEEIVLRLIQKGKTRTEVLRLINKPTHIAQTLIATLELKGLIEERLGLLMPVRTTRVAKN